MYLFEAGKRRRVMHLQRFTITGQPLFEALCGISHRFNRAINVPLGRRTCKNCLNATVTDGLNRG